MSKYASPVSPFKSMRTSITSRVVPANSDVIAASRPANGIEQGRFSDIRRPYNGDFEPRSDPLGDIPRPQFLVLQGGTNDAAQQALSPRASTSDWNLFVREINRRFKQGCGTDQIACASFPARFPRSPDRTRRAWRLCASVSDVDEIGQGLRPVPDRKLPVFHTPGA